MLIPHSGEESVVISYGIVAAMIQLLFKSPNKMPENIQKIIKNITNPSEPSVDHPDAIFRVYEFIDDCFLVEMKVRCNRDGIYLHILRVYKKSGISVASLVCLMINMDEG